MYSYTLSCTVKVESNFEYYVLTPGLVTRVGGLIKTL